MARKDQAYWQRLRKDVRSSVAGGLAVVAVLATTISLVGTAVPGTHSESRGNPLYWLLMLPAAWWVSGLTSFEPFYVRSWKPAMAITCLVSLACAVVSMHGRLVWTFQGGAFIVAAAAAIASLLTYRNSLVAREGPAR